MHSDGRVERDIEGKDISSKHTNITPVTVEFVPLYEFNVNPAVTYNKKNGTRVTKGSKGVFNIELIPDSNQFMVAQTHGRVSIFNLATGKRISIVNASDWLDNTQHLCCPANNPKRDIEGKLVSNSTCLRKPKDVMVRHGYSKTLTSRPQMNADFGSTMGGKIGLMSPTTDAGFSILDEHDKQIRGGA